LLVNGWSAFTAGITGATTEPLLEAFYAIGGGDFEVFISHNEGMLDVLSGVTRYCHRIGFSAVNRNRESNCVAIIQTGLYNSKC
jgi:hypothetical protein